MQSDAVFRLSFFFFPETQNAKREMLFFFRFPVSVLIFRFVYFVSSKMVNRKTKIVRRRRFVFRFLYRFRFPGIDEENENGKRFPVFVFRFFPKPEDTKQKKRQRFPFLEKKN